MLFLISLFLPLLILPSPIFFHTPSFLIFTFSTLLFIPHHTSPKLSSPHLISSSPSLTLNYSLSLPLHHLLPSLSLSLSLLLFPFLITLHSSLTLAHSLFCQPLSFSLPLHLTLSFPPSLISPSLPHTLLQLTHPTHSLIQLTHPTHLLIQLTHPTHSTPSYRSHSSPPPPPPCIHLSQLAYIFTFSTIQSLTITHSHILRSYTHHPSASPIHSHFLLTHYPYSALSPLHQLTIHLPTCSLSHKSLPPIISLSLSLSRPNHHSCPLPHPFKFTCIYNTSFLL